MAKIIGAAKVTARLKGVGPKAVELVGQALFAGGDAIRAEAHVSITRNSVSGAHHVPSAPNTPPNQDTGFLNAGFEVLQVAPLRVLVSNDIPYAVDLEFGTSKMAARPFLRPAVAATKKEVVALIKTAVDKALKG